MGQDDHKYAIVDLYHGFLLEMDPAGMETSCISNSCEINNSSKKERPMKISLSRIDENGT